MRKRRRRKERGIGRGRETRGEEGGKEEEPC